MKYKSNIGIDYDEINKNYNEMNQRSNIEHDDYATYGGSVTCDDDDADYATHCPTYDDATDCEELVSNKKTTILNKYIIPFLEFFANPIIISITIIIFTINLFSKLL